jgi:hypothetical protein
MDRDTRGQPQDRLRQTALVFPAAKDRGTGLPNQTRNRPSLYAARFPHPHSTRERRSHPAAAPRQHTTDGRVNFRPFLTARIFWGPSGGWSRPPQSTGAGGDQGNPPGHTTTDRLLSSHPREGQKEWDGDAREAAPEGLCVVCVCVLHKHSEAQARITPPRTA